MQPTPWYRVHIVTCLTVLVVGAALLWCQTGRAYRYTAVFASYDAGWRGWPLAFTNDSFNMVGVAPSAVAANALVALLLLSGTGISVELLTRRVTTRLQFSLTAALGVTTALAILLGERYAEFNMYVLANQINLRPTLLIGYPWYLYVPIYFAIFCTLCSFCWIVVALITRWWRRFDR